jgi:U4/U6.U5 tri-snRNP-associated protein 1
MSSKEGNVISQTIEEANELRARLGLPLLRESNDSEVNARENNRARIEEEEKKRKRKELADQIEHSRGNKRPKGKGLAEGKDEDLAVWLARQKKKTEALPSKRKPDNERKQETYSAENLVGMKVAHDFDELGSETVLILKDRSITDKDDGEDELVNQGLLDAEHGRKNIQTRKGAKAYNAYEAFERDQMGLEKKMLTQYDEIDGPVGFTIQSGGKVDPAELEAKKQSVGLDLKGTVSLEYEKNKEIADFYTQDEVLAFRRKPKKKSSKKKKMVIDWDDVEEDTGVVEEERPKFGFSNKQVGIDNVNFVDDDELHQTLAKLRNKNNRKVLSNPEALAQRIQDQQDSEPEMDLDGGLVISEISEFVQNIQTQQEDDLPLDEPSKSPIHEEPNEAVKEIEMDTGENMENTTEGALPTKSDVSFLEEEPLVSQGLAATLKLLSRKGDLESGTQEQRTREHIINERLKWSKLQSQADRIERNKLSEKKLAELAAKKFENYRPDIDLTYRDEMGRELTAKQAYRELSHKFHGKLPGKAKKEKQLRKIAEEMRMKRMDTSDTPLKSVEAFSEKSKQLGVAYVEVPANAPLYESFNDRAEVLHPKISQSVEKSEKKRSAGEKVSVPKQETGQQADKMIPVQVIDTEPVNRTKITFGLTKGKNLAKVKKL